MLTHVLAFAMNHPRSIQAAGELTSRVSGGALAAGLIFNALAGVFARLLGAQGPITAAQFLPAVPTWWVPESPAGAAAWAFVLGLGLTAMLVGRELRRQMEAY